MVNITYHTIPYYTATHTASVVEVLTSLHDIPDTLSRDRNASTHSTVYSAEAKLNQGNIIGYGDNIVPKPSEDPYRDPEMNEEKYGFGTIVPANADDAPPPKPALPLVCMVSYGIAWYGMVSFGIVWYRMVWYGIVWYGANHE